ncbi:hypothetical protein D3C78_341950 [compost metagenome]
MKPSMAIKPLVFAVAAVMAVAVQADERRGNDHHHGGGHHQQQPRDPHQDPRFFATASATLNDQQDNYDNFVLNQGTENTADVNGSLNEAEGNAGLNVAAGDMNQQDNEAAIASSDADWIFGGSYASTDANQSQHDNIAVNISTTNSATLDGSANNSSGNVGVNVAAGDFNQQKNMMAAASSGGRYAIASGPVNQDSTGNVVSNLGVATFEKETLRARFEAEGTYKGWGSGVVIDDKDRGGYGHRGKDKVDKDPLYFKEAGTFELSGTATYQVLVPTGFTNVVTNDATVTGSLNGASGNVGANVAAGVGNQQANSLSIAACQSCL